jgi:hypothetical protein
MYISQTNKKHESIVMKKICTCCNTEQEPTKFYKDKSKKDGRHPWCKTCWKPHSAKYYAENKPQIAQTQLQYVAKNKDKVLASARARAQSKYWADPNKARARVLAYIADNPVKNLLRRNANRATLLKAVPPWFDAEAVRSVYELAQEFRSAGFKVHVDHIVPLKGRTVCGLHVFQNLRVCLAEVNIRKSNKFEGEVCA